MSASLAVSRRTAAGLLAGRLAGSAPPARRVLGLMATSAWLISRAAQHPPVLHLMVAIVAVRAFGIGRGVLRYVERLVGHDAAFRVLGRTRVQAWFELDRSGPRPRWFPAGRPPDPRHPTSRPSRT